MQLILLIRRSNFGLAQRREMHPFHKVRWPKGITLSNKRSPYLSYKWSRGWLLERNQVSPYLPYKMVKRMVGSNLSLHASPRNSTKHVLILTVDPWCLDVLPDLGQRFISEPWVHM